MAEELQNLLDKIQSEGVAKAEAEAGRILAAAEADAASVAEQARNDAADVLRKADLEAKAFEERGRKALQQAARDVVISVGDAVAGTFRALVNREVGTSLSPQALADMLGTFVKAYVESTGGSGKLDVLLNPQQQEALTEHFLAKYGDALREGVEIKGDGSVVSGFKVSVVDDEVHHDFSAEAITESICRLLRPHLSEIVRSVQK